MIKSHARYVFAADCFVNFEETGKQVRYGWTWNNISLIVGCLPSDAAQKRIDEVNALNLQFVEDDMLPLPLLGILKTPSSMSPGSKTPVWITYRTPNLRAQRFYTTEALELNLALKSENDNTDTPPYSINADFLHPPPTVLEGTPSVKTILDHLNISPVVDQLVQGTLKTSQLLVTAGSTPSSLNVSPAPRWRLVRKLATQIGTAPLGLLVALCNIPMPISRSGSTLAKDVSATLQQVDIRLEQVLNSKAQFNATKLENLRNVGHSTARYINFFNWVWLIINDIIIGFAIGGVIRDNKDALARLALRATQWYFIESLQETLHWLNNWPVGLKLNTELSRFLCDSFVAIIDCWGSVLQFAAPYLPLAFYCIGCSGILGMTMLLSLTADLLGVLTLHTYICYLVATTVFARLLGLLDSFFNLFRGKRRNILRNRIDNWNYDVDQLLLGTILFTLVAFLIPTVTVYYLLFTLTRLAIIGIQACLETALAFLNHFPLFALMLRVKDPARLPGGIELCLKSSSGVTTNTRVRLELMNKPISFSRIFFQHLTVWSRLSSHYNPLRLLRCLLTGALIMPISRYSIRFGLPSSKPGKIKTA